MGKNIRGEPVGMNEHNRKIREREMKKIWESWEFHIREKLVSLDNIARQMMNEMAIFGVPKDMVDDFVPRQFERLCREVIREQSEKYDSKSA